MLNQETAHETLLLKCNGMEKIVGFLSRRKKETQANLNLALKKMEEINKHALMRLEGDKFEELFNFLKQHLDVVEGKSHLAINLGDKEISPAFIDQLIKLLSGNSIFYEVYFPLVMAKAAAWRYSTIKLDLKNTTEHLKNDENFAHYSDTLSDIYMIAERPMNIYDESLNLKLFELINNLTKACSNSQDV